MCGVYCVYTFALSTLLFVVQTEITYNFAHKDVCPPFVKYSV